MQEVQSNVAIVRRFYEEALTAQRLDVLDEIFPSSYLFVGPQLLYMSRDQLRRAVSDAQRTSAQRFDVADAFGAGDRVVARIVTTPPQENVPPSQSVAFVRLANGRIEEMCEIRSGTPVAPERAPEAPRAPRGEASTPAENIALVRRTIDELNHGNLGVVEETYAEDTVLHAAGAGAPRGREGVRRSEQEIRAVFPDLCIVVDELVATEDKVGVRGSFTGTHEGPLGDWPPSHKRVAWRFAWVLDIEDRRICGVWSASEFMAMIPALAPQPSA